MAYVIQYSYIVINFQNNHSRQSWLVSSVGNNSDLCSPSVTAVLYYHVIFNHVVMEPDCISIVFCYMTMIFTYQWPKLPTWSYELNKYNCIIHRIQIGYSGHLHICWQTLSYKSVGERQNWLLWYSRSSFPIHMWSAAIYLKISLGILAHEIWSLKGSALHFKHVESSL